VELKATAPDDEGLHNCSVAFPACDHGLPHQAASTALSFVTVPPGRHRVSVAIVERETRAPIADAQVRLGYYRSATDESGVARFTAPSGTHRLFVWKADFSAPELDGRRRAGPRVHRRSRGAAERRSLCALGWLRRAALE
jgi:hypothetical protein